jgi:hypothetical protein
MRLRGGRAWSRPDWRASPREGRALGREGVGHHNRLEPGRHGRSFGMRTVVALMLPAGSVDIVVPP